jgi:peptidoglycan hydrolase-like protein with peptidoglycan-binding domain
MKKLSIVLMGVFIFFSLGQNVHAATIFTKDLRYGVKNSAAVRDLQQFLKDQGDFNYDLTGNFYSVTQTAVKKFQQEQAIKITGVFDKTTRDRANELLSISDQNFSDVTATAPASQNISASVVPSATVILPSQNLPATDRKTHCLDQVNTGFPLSATVHLTIVNAENELTAKKTEYQNCLTASGVTSCQTILQQVLDKAATVNQLLQAPTLDKPGTAMADYEQALAACTSR